MTSAADSPLHNFARRTRDDLLEFVEPLAGSQPNRTPVLALLRLATDQARAAMLADALHEQNFLDSRDPEPEDRYAWDCVLHAVEFWAVLAQQPKQTEGRAEHLICCGLNHEILYWIARAQDALNGVDVDQVGDRLANAQTTITQARAILDTFDTTEESILIQDVRAIIDRIDNAVAGRDQDDTPWPVSEPTPAGA